MRLYQSARCGGEIVVLRLSKLAPATFRRSKANVQTTPLDRRAQARWMLGNCLMLIGVITLLYAGGLYSIDEYGRYAARGDTDAPVPDVMLEPQDQAEPAPFVAPILNAQATPGDAEAPISSALPAAPQEPATVTRVAIPSIGVDSKVVEVGWDVQDQGGQQVAIWQVAKYAVGQHRGSANPGGGNNIVLAGHVGGFGKVFKDLFYVKPGDQITLYSQGEQYLYTVQDRLLVTEEGVPAEQHAENAKLIGPTDHETVTLVTCWPDSGPDKFTQRVVVQAVPFAAASGTSQGQSSWTMR